MAPGVTASAIETAPLPPKARSAGIGVRRRHPQTSRDNPDATVADQLSLLLDASGYRQMLRDSRAETTEGRLDNVQELIQLAGQFHTRARTARPCRPLDRRTATTTPPTPWDC